MGSQYLLITSVCFWLPLVSFTISVASQKSTTGPGNVIEGNVFINGTTSIGRIDDDFVCATLDWWPPEKCDYGTCSWGRDSLLNLVSWSSSKWFFFFASLCVLCYQSNQNPSLPISLLSFFLFQCDYTIGQIYFVSKLIF